MKKNLVSVIVIVALFGALAFVALDTKGENGAVDANAKDQANAVKICPHSGLPCTGEGDCDETCEDESDVDESVATDSVATEVDAAAKNAEEAVKICPNSGLPCTGEDDCEEDVE